MMRRRCSEVRVSIASDHWLRASHNGLSVRSYGIPQPNTRLFLNCGFNDSTKAFRAVSQIRTLTFPERQALAEGLPCLLVRRNRDRCQQPGDPGYYLVRALPRDAPGRRADAPLGTGRHGHAHLPLRGDQDRHPPGAPRHSAAPRHQYWKLPGHRSRSARRRPGMGVPSRTSASAHVQDSHHLCARISSTAGQVLIPRPGQQLHQCPSAGHFAWRVWH